jgi:hypothetical protein
MPQTNFSPSQPLLSPGRQVRIASYHSTANAAAAAAEEAQDGLAQLF